jgi:hypothetical protein
MTSLEDLKPGLKVTGILPDQSVTIVDVKWHGSTAVELLQARRWPARHAAALRG